MLQFDTTTRSLEILLEAAVATNQLSWVASWVDLETTGFGLSGANSATGVTNGTTAVTMVAAPGAGTTRKLTHLNVFNGDTATAEVIVRYNDNAVMRSIIKFTLLPGQSLEFHDGFGFHKIEEGGNIIGPSISTHENLPQWDGVSGRLLKDGRAIGVAGPSSIPDLAAADLRYLRSEAGSWTPAISAGSDIGSINYTTQAGQYVRHGNIVFVGFEIVIDTILSAPSGGDFRIIGLPFSSVSAWLTKNSGSLSRVEGMQFATTAVGRLVRVPGAFIQIREVQANGNSVNVNAGSCILNGSRIEGSAVFVI